MWNGQRGVWVWEAIRNASKDNKMTTETFRMITLSHQVVTRDLGSRKVFYKEFYQKWFKIWRLGNFWKLPFTEHQPRVTLCVRGFSYIIISSWLEQASSHFTVVETDSGGVPKVTKHSRWVGSGYQPKSICRPWEWHLKWVLEPCGDRSVDCPDHDSQCLEYPGAFCFCFCFVLLWVCVQIQSQ